MTDNNTDNQGGDQEGVGSWLIPDQPSVDSRGVTASEQEAIIAALLEKKAVLNSADPVQQKAYFARYAPTPEEAARLTGPGTPAEEQELREMVEFMAAFAYYTEEQLRAPETIWTRVSDTKVQIKIKTGENSASTITVNKMSAGWF